MKTIVKCEVVPITVAGCGHVIWMEANHEEMRRADHQWFYCTVCGQTNHFPGESDLDKANRRLRWAKEEAETLRAQRDHKEYQRRAERAAKTRIKNRIAKGVCPCCNRHFENLAKHMATKHPSYAGETDSE